MNSERGTKHGVRTRAVRWLILPATLLLMAAATVEAPSFVTQLGQAATLVDANRNEEALAALDALLAVTDTPIERGQIEGLRSFALARLNRLPEARKAIETSVASAPAPSLLILRQLFLLRAFDGDPAGASDTLQLIAASFPEGVSDLPSEVVIEVMRAIKGDENRAFNVDFSLVTAGWSPADATVADLDWIRLRLITALVKRDRLEDARPILAQVLNPVVLVRLGIDRRFEPLWPAIEARLGPGADIADAAFMAAAKARFDKDPTSLIARLGYAEALNVASLEPQAITVADAAKTPEELAALKDREVWLVNLHAALLGDAGKIDEAMARYAALNATPINGRASIVATIINQALFAESVDRPKDALAAADFADKSAAAASDYGRAFIAQVRACALQQLGEKAQAAAVAAPLLAKPDENGDASLGVMICLGKMDAAAALIIKRLESADERTEMLFELQPFLIADREKPRDARERAALRTLKARPDVKAAFVKAGRDLPAGVAPPR